jgi:hypothetical protein
MLIPPLRIDDDDDDDEGSDDDDDDDDSNDNGGGGGGVGDVISIDGDDCRTFDTLLVEL